MWRLRIGRHPIARPNRAVVLACLALMALVVSACGAGDDGGDGEQAADEPTATEATSETMAPSPTGEPPATGQPEQEGGGEDPAEGDPMAFSGETLTLVVPYSAGGGYDVYFRMLAPYLEKHGDVVTVVDNRTGAGGLLAANSVFADAGNPLQLMQGNGPGFTGSWLVGAEGVRFEMDEFSWIARMSAEDQILGVSGDSGFETIEELIDSAPFSWAVTGPGSTAMIHATVMAGIFGIEIDAVPGFENTPEMTIALIRGDIDAHAMTPSSAAPVVEAGDFRPLVALGEERTPFFPDVPAYSELDLDEDQAVLQGAVVALLELGRPILAPPGLSDEDLAALRALVDAAMNDPDFVAEAEATDRPMAYLPGEAMEEMIAVVADAPPEFVELLEQAHAE
jgi:tripartite-type tricarboxylate transporter receptor subunit TctC